MVARTTLKTETWDGTGSPKADSAASGAREESFEESFGKSFKVMSKQDHGKDRAKVGQDRAKVRQEPRDARAILSQDRTRGDRFEQTPNSVKSKT
jgi:hypothetical protein